MVDAVETGASKQDAKSRRRGLTIMQDVINWHSSGESAKQDIGPRPGVREQLWQDRPSGRRLVGAGESGSRPRPNL